MASVIDRNRISWCSSAEDCSGARRLIRLQLGSHKTEGASRLLIFCVYGVWGFFLVLRVFFFFFP